MSIEINGLSKSYGENKVIDNISLSIGDGSRTCIMGPSGCGKTTLINLIMGLVKPDNGEITGVPKKISAVFQEDRLCENFSAFANVSLVMPKNFDKQKIIDMLSAVGLEDSIYNKISELSGGMQRRVAIVRAIAAEKELYIMDEPFKGLDESTRKTVAEFVKSKTKGKTVICITHDRIESKLLDADIFEMEKNQ